jgi:hypothetical protein
MPASRKSSESRDSSDSLRFGAKLSLAAVEFNKCPCVTYHI